MSRKNDVLKNFAIFIAGVSGVSCGLSGLQFYQKEAPTLMFSCECCEMFKNTYFEEHLRPAASYFVKKNKYS